MAVTAATATQLADLRGDLADTAALPAFSDADLERLWQRAGGRHKQTLALAVWQLLMDATRLHDFMLGQGATDQKKSQVTAHLRDRLKDLGGVPFSGGAGASGLASIQFGTANSILDPDAEDDEA
jgi:hypothetical protein